MTTLLTKLPESLVSSMLSKWLKTKTISRLDVAFCNHAERSAFLSLLGGYVTSESDFYSIGPKYFAKMHWMNGRSLCGSYLKFNQAPPLTMEHVSTLRTYITNSAKHFKTVEVWRKCRDIKIVLQMIAMAECSLTALTITLHQDSDLQAEWDAPMCAILNNSADTLTELIIDTSDPWVLFLGLGVELTALRKVSLLIHNDTELTTMCAVAPNLREIHLLEPACTSLGLAAIGQHCVHLETFTVDGDSTRPVVNIDLGIVGIAERCPELKHLSLTWCLNLTDAALNAVARHCTQMETLALSGTGVVTSAPIVTLAQRSSATLQSLSLDNCRSINGDSIVAVAKHCALLHTLRVVTMDAVSGAHVMQAIPCLKNLTSLKLHQHELSDAVLALIAAHMHKLEYLRLSPQGDLLFTSEGLLLIVQACEKLHTLELAPNPAIWSKDKWAVLEQARPGLRVSIAFLN